MTSKGTVLALVLAAMASCVCSVSLVMTVTMASMVLSWGHPLGSVAVAPSGGGSSGVAKLQSVGARIGADSTAVAPSSSSTAGSSKGTFATKFSAPYLLVKDFGVDLANGPCKFYTLAFLTSGPGGKPAWDGQETLVQPKLAAGIKALRAKGGDVIVSCGGAGGQELGFAIKDAKQLQSAYQSIVNAYGLKRLDLDIEGGQLEPVTVNTRNIAVAALQKANPGLVISYTLSCDVSGLNSLSKDLLANAKKNGVKVGCVNCMLMEMPQNSATNVIAGAKNAYAQCQALGTGSKIGICPMIGVNDSGEPHTLADAAKVAAFAKSTPWVQMLTFWSLGRDNGACAGKKQADGTCSGIAQSKYAFAKALSL